MDKERRVSYKEGRQFAQMHGFKFMETSAKTGQNIEEAFLTVTQDIYTLLGRGDIQVEEGWEGVKNGLAHPDSMTLNLSKQQYGSGGCC